MSSSTSSNGEKPAASTSGSISTPYGDIATLTFEPLDEGTIIRSVRDASAGATCAFVGTTRNTFEGKVVSRLEYESYTPVALKTMQSILLRARSKDWPPPSASIKGKEKSSASSTISTTSSGPDPITRICIVHRLGNVPVREASIVVAVSSPHRRESFERAEWALEEVKKHVQIWKREVYETAGSGNGTAANGADEKEHAAWKRNFASNTS